MSQLPLTVRRAVCYLRKSREDEEAERRGEDTLLKQRELMVREVLSRYSFESDIVEEIASGDSIRERPVFRDILPLLGTKYDAILCKDLSRLGRGNYGDMGVVYDIIRDRRIFIVTKDTVYDPSNFSDLRMIRFSLFFNREEYEMTLWRLTEGKFEGATRGKWVAGSVPYGFRYDANHQVPVPVEDEAKIVRLIFQWYIEEELGHQAISRRLLQLGVPSPRGKTRWHPEVIHRLLQNPAYIGRLEFRRTQRNKFDGKVVKRPQEEHIVVEQAFQAIVPETVWKGVQARMATADTKPKTQHNFKLSALASTVSCGGCGKKMVRRATTSYYHRQDGTRSKYSRESLYCATCGYSVKYADCESQLLELLHQLQTVEPRLLTRFVEDRLRSRKSEETMDGEAVRKRLRKRQTVIEQRIRRATDCVLDGTFSKSEYQAVRASCEAELEELGLRMASVPNRADALSSGERAVTRAVPEQLRSLADAYCYLSATQSRNQLLLGLFEQVKLTRTSHGTSKSNPNRFDLHVRLNRRLWI